MSLEIRGTLLYLGAKKYDFIDSSGKEIQGVTVSLFDVEGEKANQNLAGGEVSTYSQSLDNWSLYSGLKPLTKVEVQLVQSGKKLRLVSLKPVKNDGDLFEDVREGFE